MFQENSEMQKKQIQTYFYEGYGIIISISLWTLTLEIFETAKNMRVPLAHDESTNDCNTVTVDASSSL